MEPYEVNNRDLIALGVGIGATLLAFILYVSLADSMNAELRAFRLVREINDGFDRLEKRLTNADEAA